jgi:3-methyladenine DNA glycosylase AlkD
MWEKRIAIVATMHHIKKGKTFDLTQELVLNNLNHPHDLMHKANGWLLEKLAIKTKKFC